VHRYDARLTREICEAARAFAIPVLYDPIGEVSIVELIATEYPDVAFIIPHMGRFSDDWRAQHSLIDYLVRHPNIYTDTSGVRRFELLEHAAERAGAHKILFGSDGPWLHPGVELEKVRLLGLSPADEQLVLGGNFLRLISRRRQEPLALPETPLAPEPLQTEYRDPWDLQQFGA
jgi:predicted TIM-barrel fold metal-dependent hydrolase